METDRKYICKVISEMLDNPDENGIYPTSTTYSKLELYIEGVRYQTLGWCHANSCGAMDKGEDPRLQKISELMKQYRKDLGLE